MGDPHQPRRDQVGRPAARTSRPRWRSRCAPSATAAPRSSPPKARSRRQILTAEGAKQAAVLTRRGRAPGGDPARRGRSEGDRHGVHRDPRGQTRPRAAELRIPADAARSSPKATPTRCSSCPPSSRRRSAASARRSRRRRRGRSPGTRAARRRAAARAGLTPTLAAAPPRASAARMTPRVRLPLRETAGDAHRRPPARHA